jgi:hypothetical protein
MINANKTAMKLLIGRHHSEALARAFSVDLAKAPNGPKIQAARKR